MVWRIVSEYCFDSIRFWILFSDIRIVLVASGDLVASIDGYDDLSVGVCRKRKEKWFRVCALPMGPLIFCLSSWKQSFRIVMDGYQVLKNEDGCLEFSVNGKLFVLFFSSSRDHDTRTIEGINIDAVTSAEFSIAVLPKQDKLGYFPAVCV